MTAYVRLIVRDVDRSIAFYKRTLGFVLVQQSQSAFAMVRRDDLELWLERTAQRVLADHPRRAQAGPGRLDAVRPVGRPTSKPRSRPCAQPASRSPTTSSAARR